MKVLLVGRHTPTQMEGIEVVEQRNILWPVGSNGCFDLIAGLEKDAQKIGANILHQAVPGQVAVAISNRINHPEYSGVLHGVIISQPGERQAGVERLFLTDYADTLKSAVEFVNPNAKVSILEDEETSATVKVVVDPPMKFEFSHVEWF